MQQRNNRALWLLIWQFPLTLGKWPALQCCWRSGYRNLLHLLRSTVSYTSKSFFWLDNPTDFVIHPFRQVISFLLICAIEPRFWCVRCPEDEIRYCHRASIVAVSTKAQQMMIFARTKPRGIVNDTHNNQRITEPNMVKDFKRALISRGIF